VQETIYDKFVEAFTAKAKSLQVTNPFAENTYNGPQVSQVQFDRVMKYIDAGKEAGATVHLGGERVGSEGYFISPTIFTNTKPDMSIVKEEIFGPVGVLIPFKDEERMSTFRSPSHVRDADYFFRRHPHGQ
jgi:aldehyde dehydrogenase (NAD+)